MYTIIKKENLRKPALACARGRYQIDLVLGEEAWSGSTLKGRAREYSGRYAASRKALLTRFAAGHIPHRYASPRELKALGKPSHTRVLVIG